MATLKEKYKAKPKEITAGIPVRSPEYKTTTSRYDTNARSFVTVPSMEVHEDTYGKNPRQVMKIEKPRKSKVQEDYENARMGYDGN